MTPVQVGTQLNTTVTSTLRVRAGSTLALNLRGLTSSATGSPSFTEGQATALRTALLMYDFFIHRLGVESANTIG